MKYFTQTGDVIIANQTNLTSGVPSDNSVRIIKAPVIFSDRKILINNDHGNEEFTKEQEKTFYKKVFKTSLV